MSTKPLLLALAWTAAAACGAGPTRYGEIAFDRAGNPVDPDPLDREVVEADPASFSDPDLEALFLDDGEALEDGDGDDVEPGEPVGDDPPEAEPKKEEPPAELGDALAAPEKTPPTFPKTGLTAATDTKCVVTKADTKYGAPADAPLMFPNSFTPPRPGSAPANNTGKVVGTVPANDPFNGNAEVIGAGFEYHSDLNKEHGCFSQQYVADLTVGIDMTTNEVVAILPGKDGAGKPKLSGILAGRFYHDGRDFAGNTRTGIRNKFGAPIYEGTNERIHWVDAPGQLTVPGAPKVPGVAYVRFLLLKSITWNSDGKNGWYCVSGVIAASDAGTGKVMDTKAAAALLAGAKPKAGLPDGPEKQANEKAAATLKKIAGKLTDNPKYDKIECKAF